MAIGVGGMLGDMKAQRTTPVALLEKMKAHPAIAPLIAGGETRMLPQTFRGVSLTNHSLDGWMIEGGQASFTKLYNQSGHQRIGTSYGTLPEHTDSQHLDWAGVSFSGVPDTA